MLRLLQELLVAMRWLYRESFYEDRFCVYILNVSVCSAAVDKLMDDGMMFSTFDESHFKLAE